MIELFELEDGVIKPTVHCHNINWLKAIMKKWKKKEQHLAIYAYIFYMSCPHPIKNPYFNMPEEEREEAVLKDLMPIEIDTESTEILTAIEEAEKLYVTPTVRAYRGLEILMDNLTTYISTAEITAGRDGNINSLIATASKFSSIRDSFKKVKADLEAEQNTGTKRGGGDMPYDQQ